MVMDFLRSCYRTQCRFFAGFPAVTSVQWYFCPRGALPFPSRHRFGSLNWGSHPDQDASLGEVLGALRPWVDGRAPQGRAGRAFCGPASSYANGAVLGAVLAKDFLGVPLCCRAGPQGLSFGSRSICNFNLPEVSFSGLRLGSLSSVRGPGPLLTFAGLRLGSLTLPGPGVQLVIGFAGSVVGSLSLVEGPSELDVAGFVFGSLTIPPPIMLSPARAGTRWGSMSTWGVIA